MRRFAITLLALAVMLAFTMPAQAGRLSSVLTFDGIQDTLIDDSVAIGIRDSGTTGVLDAGDIVSGIAKIDERDPGSLDVDDTVGTVDLVFSAQVRSPVVNGSGEMFFDLGVPDAVSGQRVSQQLSRFSFSDPDRTMAAVLTAPVGTQSGSNMSFPAALTAYNNAAGPWDFELSTGFAPDGSGFFQVGMQDGAAGVSEDDAITIADTDGDGLVDEYEGSDVTDDNDPGVGGEDPDGVGRGTDVADESVGLDVIDQPGIPNAIFLPVKATRLNGPASPFDGTSTFFDTFFGGNLQTPSETQEDDGYFVQDNTRAKINAVPEPSSMALLGAGLASLAGFGYRRRKNESA